MIKKVLELEFVLVFLLGRSLDATSSCESGRSTVVTLRCNPLKSTKGDITVPRYQISEINAIPTDFVTFLI